MVFKLLEKPTEHLLPLIRSYFYTRSSLPMNFVTELMIFCKQKVNHRAYGTTFIDDIVFYMHGQVKAFKIKQLLCLYNQSVDSAEGRALCFDVPIFKYNQMALLFEYAP